MRAALLCLTLALGACAALQPADETPAPEPLVVASDLDNPPFAAVGDDGTPVGRDVEMIQALGQALGRPIEWRRMDFDTLVPVAQSGMVDLVCATLGVTDARAERVDFSRPYFETVIHVVVRSGEGEPRGWNDLDGRRVAAGRGTTSELAVRSKIPMAVLVLENKQQLDAAERLLLGDVDGIAMDGPDAEDLVAQSGGALTTLHTPLATEKYALAFPKGRPELVAKVDEALGRFFETGQMRRWDARHGLRSLGKATR